MHHAYNIRCPRPQLAARVFRIYYPSICTDRISNMRSGGRGERLTGKEEGFCAPGKKMPATWRQAVLVPGKLGAFPSPDAAAPRVVDREEGIRGRGVVLAVGVGEEKTGAGTTMDLVTSPDACRCQLDVLRCVTPHQQATGHSSTLVLFRPTRNVAWCGRARPLGPSFRLGCHAVCGRKERKKKPS